MVADLAAAFASVWRPSAWSAAVNSVSNWAIFVAGSKPFSVSNVAFCPKITVNCETKSRFFDSPKPLMVKFVLKSDNNRTVIARVACMLSRAQAALLLSPDLVNPEYTLPRQCVSRFTYNVPVYPACYIRECLCCYPVFSLIVGTLLYLFLISNRLF